ncbi:hypothetical protein EDC01DRAFT_634139 [Geopyxis carbonaria]|nr:hypothetical protein EDC01DRAFT_634139 [Geopyxis carbonaria]
MSFTQNMDKREDTRKDTTFEHDEPLCATNEASDLQSDSDMSEQGLEQAEDMEVDLDSGYSPHDTSAVSSNVDLTMKENNHPGIDAADPTLIALPDTADFDLEDFAESRPIEKLVESELEIKEVIDDNVDYDETSVVETISSMISEADQRNQDSVYDCELDDDELIDAANNAELAYSQFKYQAKSNDLTSSKIADSSILQCIGLRKDNVALGPETILETIDRTSDYTASKVSEKQRNGIDGVNSHWDKAESLFDAEIDDKDFVDLANRMSPTKEPPLAIIGDRNELVHSIREKERHNDPKVPSASQSLFEQPAFSNNERIANLGRKPRKSTSTRDDTVSHHDDHHDADEISAHSSTNRIPDFDPRSTDSKAEFVRGGSPAKRKLSTSVWNDRRLQWLSLQNTPLQGSGLDPDRNVCESPESPTKRARLVSTGGRHVPTMVDHWERKEKAVEQENLSPSGTMRRVKTKRMAKVYEKLKEAER